MNAYLADSSPPARVRRPGDHQRPGVVHHRQPGDRQGLRRPESRPGLGHLPTGTRATSLRARRRHPLAMDGRWPTRTSCAGIPWTRRPPSPTPPDPSPSIPSRRPWRRCEPALPAGAGAAARRSTARSGERSRLPGGAVGFGSNAWGVAAEHSASGHPMVANDAHLSLQTPSIFYENHLVVSGDPGMNLSGTTFPGNPPRPHRSQRPHRLGRDGQLQRSLGRLPGPPAARRPRLPGAPLHRVGGGSSTRWRSAAKPIDTTTSRTSGIPDDLVDGTFIVRASAPETVDVLTVPFRSFGPVVACRGPERDRRPRAVFPRDDGHHLAVRRPARHARDRGRRPLGACAGRLRLPGRGEALRRGLAELGGGRRRGEPRLLHQWRDPAAGRSRGGERGGPAGPDPGRVGTEQLDRRSGAFAGADDPVSGPAFRRDAADRQPGERFRGDREQRPGGSLARQRSVQSVSAGHAARSTTPTTGTAPRPSGPAGSPACSARRSTRGRRSRWTT